MRYFNHLRAFTTKRSRLHLPALLALLVAVCLTPVFITHAANPTSGTLNPTTGASLTWTGTAAGSPTGANTQEADCVEGQNCDTYTLTIGGNPSDWAGKSVHVEIDWTSITNDYDLYVHKGSNSGPEVNNSASIGNTSEGFDFSPNDPSVGTGTFTVHVVYSTVPRRSLRSISRLAESCGRRCADAHAAARAGRHRASPALPNLHAAGRRTRQDREQRHRRGRAFNRRQLEDGRGALHLAAHDLPRQL